mgnify:FL=1
MTIREQTCEIEARILSKRAMLSQNTRGRRVYEDPCPIRTEYQRDRDRILHSNAFRRLKHKTQVFLAPKGDHYRTRLTHTLEVSQIARTIAKAMRLNEDLTEAIALGHDLGHTPFGHAGEAALAKLSPLGYKHYLHSVRIVCFVENNLKGLNLTWEVLNGFACHTNPEPKAKTLEGQIVRFADKIAYVNHDIEDAVRAGVLSEQDLPWDSLYVLGRTKSERITTMVTSIIDSSQEKIQCEKQTAEAFERLRQFMFDTVYLNPDVKREERKVFSLLERLYSYFLRHVEQMPPEYHTIAEMEGKDRAVTDYIAGMTDQYCISLYENLFVPKGFWTGW